MREFARRGLAFVFAFLLIATAATTGVVPGASPVGDARAEWVDCSLSDPLLGAAFNTLTGTDTGCRWESGEQIDYENITATDVYAGALTARESSDSYLTTVGNFMQDTRSVAFMKAKLTLINQMEAGANESAAAAAANETVADYYSNIQYNLLQDYNAKATQIYYWGDTSSPSTVRIINPDTGSTLRFEDATTYSRSANVSKTLDNGSTTQTRAIELSDGTGFNYKFRDPPTQDFAMEVEVQNPDTSEWTQVTTLNDYLSTFENVSSQSQQVKDNVGVYAESFYAQYEQGDFNTTDIAMLDPTTIASQAATDYNSTGYYSFAATQLAAMGASGDLNASHTIEVSDGTNVTTLNGTLFYTGDDAPAGGWVTGETYNVSDFNGTLYFAYQDANSSGIADVSDLGSQFTLTSATNTKTGESLNATEPQQYVYDSTNASALADEIDRLQQLREEYETAGSGGSSSGSGGLSTEVIGGAIIVGAVAVLLIQREGNE